MAKEALPNPEGIKDLNRYEDERRHVVGGRLMASGLKSAAVGLYAAGSMLTASIPLVLTVAGATVLSSTYGVIAAGGAVAYGAVKMIEGMGNRLKAAFSGNLAKSGGGGGH